MKADVSQMTKNRSAHRIPSILDILLTIVFTCFIFSTYVFVHRLQHQIDQVHTNAPHLTVTPFIQDERRRTKTYYDYESYQKNNVTQRTSGKRRYFYIDLGCFDGRDIDHFVHFFSEEIRSKGTLTVLAFEPDPINFSACKAVEQRHPDVNYRLYQKAVWTASELISFAAEKGQKSKIDRQSEIKVDAVDFSHFLTENFALDDFVYVKFTVEGVEIPILEKMIEDGSLALVDHLEIEWNDALSPDFEPRRVSLECMFDNFGMDFLYMTNPIDSRHAYNTKESFQSVRKDKGWCVQTQSVDFEAFQKDISCHFRRLKDSTIRFHYQTRRDVADLLAERNNRSKVF